ncbi:MAG: ACT domain-containing protein [Actinobacteria bacterium]|nr:MAG: ACT domain-containing protein [Actinomycetota bacterium]
MADGSLTGFIARRVDLIDSAEPGTAATRALSDLTDEAVSALAETAFASCGIRWGLLALGAYGSQRLLPFSDLDLVVIVASDPHGAREPVQALLYPLWDAGFEVGHAVRTRKEHLRACTDDAETLTATLTGRHLAGDASLTAETLTAVASLAHRRRASLLRTLAARERPGSPYDLEPNLKEGAGGQRDLDELTWRTAIARGEPRSRPGVEASPGVLGDAKLGDLAIAQDRISAARWALHRTAGRKEAVLDADAAETTPPGGDALHEALATVHELLLAARGELLSGDLHPLPWSTRDLTSRLARGTASLSQLECAARRGALEPLAPGIAALMTLRRPALSHRLTVGAHSLLTAALAIELPATDAIAASVRSPGELPLELVAATLMHDAGKVVAGPGHPERGTPAAVTAALAMGASHDTASAAGMLVREHLLLAETASGSDIDDEDVVLRVAARIGDRDMLALLYTLTAADSMATGPSTWDAWHASLVRTLVARVDAALADDVDGAGMVAATEAVRAEALALARDDAAAYIIRNAAVRYFISRTAAEAAADARLLANLGPRGSRTQSSLRVSVADTPGAHRVTVATYDRPGVFALLAGTIALSGLDILGATAFPGPGRTVLDTFTVTPATLAEIGPETWTTFERHLTAALEGHLDLDVRLAERRRQYPSHSKRRSRIVTRTDSAFATTLDVGAPDRPGLLFDIADEVARAGFEITRVNARTREGRALDTFHIVDEEGLAPRDPGELGHLAMRLRERLARLG